MSIQHRSFATLALMFTLLTGCGGGGGGSSAIAPAPAPVEPAGITMSGVVLDGPVSGGTLFVFAADSVQAALDAADTADDRSASLGGAGAITSITLGESEDGSYSLEISGDQADAAVFIVFDNAGASDLTFGDTPFNMESVIVLGAAGSSARVNITPQTSLVARQVRAILPADAAAISAEIDTANANVIGAVGQDEIGNPLLDEVSDLIGLTDEETLLSAATALGAFIRSAAISTSDTREAVLEALALDALDGAIDGNVPASAGADEALTDLASNVGTLMTLGSGDLAVTSGSCAGTADLLRRSCEIDIMDDYFESIAVCQLLGSEDDLESCAAAALEVRAETQEECGGVFERRTSFCALVDDEVHAPEFGEAFADNFVDPLQIGLSVTPNPYLPLVVGNRWVYESNSIDDDGEEVTETVTVVVKRETKRIEGIDCIVVNDVVEEDGEVVEDTDDWFAQDLAGNVWYCGEIALNFETFEGDMPEEPELVDIGGSWKSGRDGAKAGLIVPINPEIGAAGRTEIAYGEAEDVIEIIGFNGAESTSAADCEGECLVVREFTPLEDDSNEHTFHKSGVGVILKLDLITGDREELVSFSNVPAGLMMADAKLLIEHNATDEDTGFQGFGDGEPWNEFTIADPDGDALLTVMALGGLMDFGLTELFFETSEPENAEVPLEQVVERLDEGTYAFATDVADGSGEATRAAEFSHDIPAGAVLLTPTEDESGVDPTNTVVSWELVTNDLDDEEVTIVGYQVIVEQVADPFDVDGFAKPWMSAYLSDEATSLTVPAEFMVNDACYEFEVLAIEESGNQTLASRAFTTGTGCDESEDEDPEGLKAAKVLIEHNATDEDTGYQGFADGDPWNRLTITNPDAVNVVNADAGAGFLDFGLTEFFFETNEPENAEVSISEVLARMPEGTYTFTADVVDEAESTLTATLTHNIPMGPVLLTPEAEDEDVDPENTVVSWEPVTTDLDGDPIIIVGYQVIVEIDEEPEFPSGFVQVEFSMFVPASVTSVTIPKEFMEADASYAYEVLAIEDSGNQTLSSAEFETL